MDSGAGFSCALRYSRVPPQSKNASEPKVYRCGKPSVVPYQASDSLMSRTVREIWASGPRVSVVMAWILTCGGPNYPPWQYAAMQQLRQKPQGHQVNSACPRLGPGRRIFWKQGGKE